MKCIRIDSLHGIYRRVQRYEFGRAQGIKDVYKQKYAVNSLTLQEDIKLVACPPGLVFMWALHIDGFIRGRTAGCSGTDEFEAYVKSLGKYKSGGYYVFIERVTALFEL